MARPPESTQVLENRCAIVTGASEGLGFAIAQKYVEAGAHVMICARGDARLQRARSRLQELAGPAQLVRAQRADISNPRDV